MAHAPRDLPIGAYAVIGDTRTAALVAIDGAIDWCCCPRFDGPAVFCRILDRARGGTCRVGPTGRYEATRSYLGDSNVLVTRFQAAGGCAELVDVMPLPQGAREHDTHRLLRRVEGIGGRVELELFFRPTFEFASAPTRVIAHARGALALAEGHAMELRTKLALHIDDTGAATGTILIGAGERLWIEIVYASSDDALPEPCNPEIELARTREGWERWAARCAYEGPYGSLVRRSALTLALLTYSPSGALVAAPTTSLPEEIGGVRNWDYRYVWLRDASLTLRALMGLGYHDEAMAFWRWLEALGWNDDEDPQVLYTLDGAREAPERVLTHLAGYRGSRPVRIGNAAAGQRQLDVFGHVLDAALVCRTAMGAIGGHAPAALATLAERAAARWREPDHGIWEMRGEQRHFVHSKLMAWVALDRARRLAEMGVIEGASGYWAREREAVRRAILAHGVDGGVFTRSFAEPALDAAALVLPLVGFVPATDPRVRATAARIDERLTHDGLVYRYLSEDGLPGAEGAFPLCTFWLAENLAMMGELERAHERFERVVRHVNDVGLLAEQIDPKSGELLGNFPQAFSHLGVIRTALRLARAEADARAGSLTRERSMPRASSERPR